MMEDGTPDGSSGPEMSAILVTPDTYETIRRTVAALAAQTGAERLELVVVAPPSTPIDPHEPDLRSLARVTVVRDADLASSSSAKAAGIRAAAAPIVVLMEDHAFPTAGWSSALIARFDGPWVAVGPAVRNAIPRSLIAWADHLIGYGAWTEGVPGGEVEFLPGHNSAYRKDVLLEYGDELEAMLDAETVLHWDLRARGHRLYLETGALIDHMGFGRLRPWVSAQFDNGRVFAARRIERWPVHRRIAYALASPAIPLIRVTRILRTVGRRGWPPVSNIRFLPVLAFGLVIDGAGQFVAGLTGSGRSMDRLVALHYHRERHTVGAP